MSIKDRVEDAELLWAHGRVEGAWAMALIAAAATARKRYPKPTQDSTRKPKRKHGSKPTDAAGMSDSEAFKTFIRDEGVVIMFGRSERARPNTEILLGDRMLHDVLYHHLRCFLLHEGRISDEVYFTESELQEDGRRLSALAVPLEGSGKPLGLLKWMIAGLLKVVREAPENRDLFDQ